jgi:hypothetical protein
MHVDKLMVIAGPSGVGKSFLIKQLQLGSFPQFVKQLEMADPNLWTYVLARHLEKIREHKIDRLFLHYDLTRPWRRKLRSGYLEDQPLRILTTSKEITVVTLPGTPEILMSRIVARRKARSERHKSKAKSNIRLFSRLAFLGNQRNKKKQKDVLQLYKNPSELLSLYDEWMKFCRGIKLKSHWIVNTMEDPPTFISLKEYSTDISLRFTWEKYLITLRQNFS